MKAKHIGTCQICGSAQKLPGGRLASHGYTVRWGFFSGICAGTNHLPLEESCDYLKIAKTACEKQLETCKPDEKAGRRQFVADAARVIAAWVPRPLQVVVEVEAESAKKATATRGIRAAAADLRGAKYVLSNAAEKLSGFATSRCYAELRTLSRPTSLEAYDALPEAERIALNKAVKKIHDKWAKLEATSLKRARAAAEAVKASQTDAEWLAAADAVIAADAVYTVALEAYNALKAA